MINKVLKLASLALVAGFMTSSFDVMGMNEESTKIDKEVQCNRAAFVQVAGFNLIVDRNPNQSLEDIYNYIYPSIEQAALEDRSVVDYTVYMFSDINAEEFVNAFQVMMLEAYTPFGFWGELDAGLVHAYFTDYFSAYDLSSILNDAGYLGATIPFGNEGDSLQNVGSATCIGDGSNIKQKVYENIERKVVRKLRRDAQTTIKTLASYCAEKLAGYLYPKVVSGNL